MSAGLRPCRSGPGRVAPGVRAIQHPSVASLVVFREAALSCARARTLGLLALILEGFPQSGQRHGPLWVLNGHSRRALTPFTQVRFLTREPISVGSPGVRAIQVLEVAKASRGAKLLLSAATRAAIYACRAASAADRALSAYERNRVRPTVFIHGTENNLTSAGSRSSRARPLTPAHYVEI